MTPDNVLVSVCFRHAFDVIRVRCSDTSSTGGSRHIRHSAVRRKGKPPPSAQCGFEAGAAWRPVPTLSVVGVCHGKPGISAGGRRVGRGPGRVEQGADAFQDPVVTEKSVQGHGDCNPRRCRPGWAGHGRHNRKPGEPATYLFRGRRPGHFACADRALFRCCLRSVLREVLEALAGGGFTQRSDPPFGHPVDAPTTHRPDSGGGHCRRSGRGGGITCPVEVRKIGTFEKFARGRRVFAGHRVIEFKCHTRILPGDLP